jgi:GGDEF domain-containing protein
MHRLISGWTEQHVPVALALVVAVLGGAVASTAPAPYSLVGVGAMVATALGALFLDALGGLALGVVLSAGVVLSRRLGEVWTRDSFVTALTLVLGLAALGWLTGMVSAGIHRRVDREPERGEVTPAFGSLGLLTADLATARLEEEVVRARRHRRPLTVVVVRVTVGDPALPPPARAAALRAVARLVESMVRDTDVPFALGPDEVGAILPETDAPAAWDVVGPVLDAATRATFAVREQEERRRLVDVAELHAGLAVLGDRTADADTLLEAAGAAARADEARAGPVRHAAPDT